MKKQIKLFSLLMCLLLALSCIACTTNEIAPTPTVAPTALATAAPTPVTTQAPPEQLPEQRIVCLAPSMVEVVYALGFGEQIVGWSAFTDYPVEATEREGWVSYHQYENIETKDFNVEEELAKDVAVVSKYFDYNATIVEKLEPTLVLGEGSEQAIMVDELVSKGYTALNFQCTSIEDIYTMMLTVGEALGVKDKAQELVDGYKARIAEISAITAELEPVKVYFEIAHRVDYGEYGVYGPYTEGANTPFEEMIKIAGGVNVYSDIDGYNEVTFEDTVSRNPGVILSPYWPNAGDSEVTTLYEIMTRPGFDTTDAVKYGRVYYYDSSLMKRFGPRTVTAIEKLAYLLHPYYFENPENSVSPWELGKIDMYEFPDRPLN
jgi:iron complex transport system substrate-binding protein